MGYPLDVGGVDDYPVKVGSMLLTLVDPAEGYERAYNRWYERDHYYGGCMVGPWLFAGSRWVATRPLKERRWPETSPIAEPTGTGSYLAVYWVEEGHHHDHFAVWSIRQVRDLYLHGRGFAERTHVHTSTFRYVGTTYRDKDPVPVELALDHRYDGLYVLWWDAVETTGAELHAQLASDRTTQLIEGSPIAMATSWIPPEVDDAAGGAPMDLGSPAGGAERLVQLLFVEGGVDDVAAAIRAYTDGVEADGTAHLLLAAPFLPTIVGTDTYVDQL